MLTLKIIPTEYTDEEHLDLCRHGNGLPWRVLTSRIAKDPRRNALIEKTLLEILKDPVSRVLVFAESVDTCKAWAARLFSQYTTGLIVGDTKADIPGIIGGLESGSLRIAFGNRMAENLDIPSLTHVILINPVSTTDWRKLMGKGSCASSAWFGSGKATFVYFWDREVVPNPYESGTLGWAEHKRSEYLRDMSNILHARIEMEGCGKVIDISSARSLDKDDDSR